MEEVVDKYSRLIQYGHYRRPPQNGAVYIVQTETPRKAPSHIQTFLFSRFRCRHRQTKDMRSAISPSIKNFTSTEIRTGIGRQFEDDRACSGEETRRECQRNASGNVEVSSSPHCQIILKFMKHIFHILPFLLLFISTYVSANL